MNGRYFYLLITPKENVPNIYKIARYVVTQGFLVSREDKSKVSH